MTSNNDRQLPEVVFDEAGQTGSNLLDAVQPIFCLASVNVSKDTAAALIPTTGNLVEFHYAQAARSTSGRRGILKVLNSPFLADGAARYGCADKSFMLTSKVVSILVEPVLADRMIFIENDRTAYTMSKFLHQHLEEHAQL